MFASDFRSALGVWGPREPPRSAQTDHRATSGLLLDLLMRGGQSWAWEKPGRRTWPRSTWRGRGLAAFPRARRDCRGAPPCWKIRPAGVCRSGVSGPLTSGARGPAGSRPPPASGPAHLGLCPPHTRVPGGSALPPPGLAYLCPPHPAPPLDTAGSAPPLALALSLVNSCRFSRWGSLLEVIEMAPAPLCPLPPSSHRPLCGVLPGRRGSGQTPPTPAGTSAPLLVPGRDGRGATRRRRTPRWLPNLRPRPGAVPGTWLDYA